MREDWPVRFSMNQWLVCPPETLRSTCQAAQLHLGISDSDRSTDVRFAQLGLQARFRSNCRREALRVFNRHRRARRKEKVADLESFVVLELRPLMRISPRSLQRWRRHYDNFGFDGLHEQKLGRVGRRRARMENSL